MRCAIRSTRSTRGQASVELIAALPLVAVIAALLLQVLVAGHSWLAVNQAAGVAAREFAMAVARGEAGGPAARKSAREALPKGMRAGARVTLDSGRVTIARRVRAIPVFGPISGKLPPLRSSAEFAQ